MFDFLKIFGKQVMLTFVRHLLSLALSLAVSVLLARVLGAQGNGIYGMAILLPTLLATFLNLGIGPSNVYFIASGKVDPKTTLNTSMNLWLWLSVFGLVFGFLWIVFFSETHFPGVEPAFLQLSLWVFPLALFNTFLTSILQGLKDFKRFNLVVLVTPLSNLAFALITVLLFELSIFGAILAYLLGQLVTGIILIFQLPVTVKFIHLLRFNDHLKESISYGYKTHLSNVLTFINYRADLFLVNYFLGPVFTGVYLIGVQIAERAWTISHAVSTVLLPHLAELQQDEALRKQLTPFVGRGVFIVTLLGSLLLYLLSEVIIDFLFGPEFNKAVQVLIWLLPGICFGSVSRVFANDISARGRPELNFYVAIVIVVVNIVSNILLIPTLGMIGGALATSIAYFLNMVLKIVLYVKLTRISWTQVLFPNKLDYKLYNALKRKMLNG